ncbi:MAG: hypothetical protein KFF46_09255 [Desulfobacterales bacterium]|nr:hypothetical protein [Desulfobacterales bacterium]
MESLIFFLVVAVIIIANIVKARKKLDKGASAPPEPSGSGAEPEPGPEKKPPAGWKRSMRDLLAELREEVTKQKERQTPEPAKQPTGRGSGWQDLVRTGPQADKPDLKKPSRDSGEKPPADRQALPQPERKQTLIESRSRQGWTPEARIGETTRRPPAPALEQMGKKELKTLRSHQFSRHELRRAVIWYEVLGPPMSLRDPEREMWL